MVLHLGFMDKEQSELLSFALTVDSHVQSVPDISTARTPCLLKYQAGSCHKAELQSLDGDRKSDVQLLQAACCRSCPRTEAKLFADSKYTKQQSTGFVLAVLCEFWLPAGSVL